MKISVPGWCVLFLWIVAAGAETVKVENDPKSSELVEVQKLKLESLTSVTSVAVSPDGRFLYAAAFNPGVINVFQRNIETGQLVFDSSIDRKPSQPLEFTMSDVIPGWAEALKRMKVGDKWQIFIPSELAYDAEPPPGSVIGPNAVLVFEIELLDAAPAAKAAPATSRK